MSGKVGRTYTAAAVIFLNLALLFVLANLVAFVSLSLLGPETKEKPEPQAWLIDSYGFDRLARAYPGWTAPDLRKFLQETSNWEAEYEPYTQFRFVPREARFITMSPNGYRVTRTEAPWPPSSSNVNVFFFGGSTTMGAGVPDDQTIPFHFQKLATSCDPRIAVYNFGRGFYFSTQERILFEQLILQGIVPKVAIFINGLNDFYYAEGAPQWSDEFRGYFEQVKAAASGGTPQPASNGDSSLGGLLARLPLLELYRRLAGPPDSGKRAPAKVSSSTERLPDVTGQMAYPAPAEIRLVPTAEELARTRGAALRMKGNREIVEAIGEKFGIRVMNVLQPVPTFGYDLRYLNVFEGKDDVFGSHRLSAAGYTLLQENSDDVRGRALWLGEIQEGRRQNLYVDASHYSEAFSREIAAAVFAEAKSRGLIGCSR